MLRTVTRTDPADSSIAVVGHGRVAQAVPERPPRGPGRVPVREPAADDVVVEQVTGVLLGLRPGLRQPAVRLGVAAEHVGHPVAELLPAVRGPHDRGGVVAERAEHVRVGRDDDEDRRRVGLQHRAGELGLRLGQPQVRAVLGLPAEQVGVVADGEHDDVGVARRVDRARGPGPDRAQREPLGGRRGGRVGHEHAAVALHHHPAAGARVLQRDGAVVVPVRPEALLRHPAVHAGRVRAQDPAAPVQSRPDPAARSVRTPSPQSVTSWWAAVRGGGGEGARPRRRPRSAPVGAGPQRDACRRRPPRPTGSSASAIETV